MRTNIKFLVSNVDITGKLPVKLFEKCYFRKAKNDEIDVIQETLDRLIYDNRVMSSISFKIPYRSIYETDMNGKLLISENSRDKWRYYVISTTNGNKYFKDIEKISTLLSVDFDYGFEILYNRNISNIMMFMSSPAHIFELYRDMIWSQKIQKNISSSEIKNIRNIYDKLLNIEKDELFFVKFALDEFYQLRRVTNRSRLITVGYFSIIESLVAHKPRLNESLDSINHQVVNKLILLSKRFGRIINQSDYFDNGVPEDTVWKKLYSYRSCIAHGDKTDFKKSLQILKSRDSVNSYLKEVVKELILLGINDPLLLCYLKKC